MFGFGGCNVIIEWLGMMFMVVNFGVVVVCFILLCELFVDMGV